MSGSEPTYNPPSLPRTLLVVKAWLPISNWCYTLSNYLDAVSQTQCGYQPPKSGLRDRRELHSSTALPLTFCELGPHLQNESVVQMISKASSSPDILCLLKHPRLGRTPSFTIVSNYGVFRAIRALDQLAG